MTGNKYPAAVIFGATGSVGSGAVDVCRELSIPIRAIGAGGKSIEKAQQLIREFSVEYCHVANEEKAAELKSSIADTRCKVVTGKDGFSEICEKFPATVLNAVSGAAGLDISFAAAKAGRRIALANKESMVIAGELLKKSAKEHGAEIIPVDSEHCAIFECLHNGKNSETAKIILTASGGPFFGKKSDEIKNLGKAEALRHPTWDMGPKITIDSATLCNKGMEVIEAVRLFDVSPDKIEVVVHRESIVHSLVEFCDMSTFALLSNPDMRLPCAHAFTYPERAPTSLIKPLDLSSLGKLSFYKPDTETFIMLPLAFYAIEAGGVIPAVFNAADEAAVAAFLDDKITFGEISAVVDKVTRGFDKNHPSESLEDLMNADRKARETVFDLIKG